MGMRPPWVALADEQGERALRTVSDAFRNDNIIDKQEAPAVIRDLLAWKRLCRTARTAKSLADCAEHQVDIGPYFEGKVNDHRGAVDELPDTKEAT